MLVRRVLCRRHANLNVGLRSILRYLDSCGAPTEIQKPFLPAEMKRQEEGRNVIPRTPKTHISKFSKDATKRKIKDGHQDGQTEIIYLLSELDYSFHSRFPMILVE